MKKVLKIVALLIAMFSIGGIGELFFAKYFPLENNTNQNQIIIEKTKEVIIGEDRSLGEISLQASSAIIEIYSYPQAKNKKNILTSEAMRTNGITLTSDGLAVTYRNGILEEGAVYKVLTYGGDFFDAELLAVDEYTNLAYFKINASNLATVSFSNSDDIQNGDNIIILRKSIFKNQANIKSGIINEFDSTFNLAGKSLSFSDKLEGVFKIDSVSNKKYVGSPIINYGGEVVGIVGLLEINNENIYFGITANVVQKSIDNFSRNRFSQQVKLGVYYIPIDNFVAEKYKLAVKRGAYLYSELGTKGLTVLANSVAKKAGLKTGDIVLAVNDDEVNLEQSLSTLVNKYEQGDEVKLKILRAEKEMELKVKF